MNNRLVTHMGSERRE